MSLNKSQGLTYRAAGVDIDAGNEAVELMKGAVRSTYRPEVLGGIGGFGGLFALNAAKYAEPVLVSGTDGVGTKLRIALMAGKHDTIGQDAVAMSVNDILVQGAEPLFFLDYIAVGSLDPQQVATIVGGIAGACRESGCALIGGETAEMAGFYAPGDYDLAGFAVGIVEKSKLITGDGIRPGDRLIGLPSSGLHSNGFSLVRKICFEVRKASLSEYIPDLGRTLGEELLVPTRLYPRVCLPLFDSFAIKGLVHITGGGFYDNIPRILPADCGVTVDTTAWPPLPVFGLLQEWGGVEWPEMYRTFNMGIGMILVVSPEEEEAVLAHLAERNEPAYSIGTVTAGNRQVELRGGVFDD